MTDDLDRAKTDESLASGSMSDDVLGVASADSSVVTGLPSPTDVSLEDVEDAVKWVWRHTLGDDDDDKPQEPMAANVEFEAVEEVTTETSNVEHDDPPPPPRAE